MRAQYGSTIVAAKKFCKDLRTRQTTEERILWEVLRDRRIFDLKFYRQYPIYIEIDRAERFYIADFYCKRRKLVIEVDGLIHRQRTEYDEFRTSVLGAQGIEVIRIKNQDVRANLNDVVRTIKEAVRRRNEF